MTEKTMEISLDKDVTWFKLNPTQNGLWRVKYDSQTLSQLKTAVQNKELSPIDRYSENL